MPKELLDSFVGIISVLLSFPSVLLLFILMFRVQIRDIFESLMKILPQVKEVDVSGVKVSFSTPFGDVDVSPSVEKLGPYFFEGFTYTSKRYNFQISWPERNWTPIMDTSDLALLTNEKFGLNFSKEDMPIVITKDVESEFKPNVNVVIDQTMESITTYLDSSVKMVKQLGWKVISSEVDLEKKAGSVVLFSEIENNKLYQIVRIIMAFDRAYLVTSTQLAEGLESKQLRDDLASIINSFRLIV